MLIVSGVPTNRTERAAHGGVAPLRLPWQPFNRGADGARSVLLQRLGRADLADLSIAQLLATACGAESGALTMRPWLLSPLHCVAGLDRLHLPADGLLALPLPQWAELCRSLVQELGDGRLTVRPLDGCTALLEGVAFDDLRSVATEDLYGTDLRACQPAGPGAAQWRALQGEIELWLHAHPVNRERERAGQPRVTTLWLWGGDPPRRSRDTAASGNAVSTGVPPSQRWLLHGLGAWGDAVAQRVDGVDAVANGAADFATLAAAGHSGSVALGVDAAAGCAAIEAAWLVPAAAAVQRAEVAELTLWHRRSAWRLTRHRWWQRRPPLHACDELFAAAAEMRGGV